MVKPICIFSALHTEIYSLNGRLFSIVRTDEESVIYSVITRVHWTTESKVLTLNRLYVNGLLMFSVKLRTMLIVQIGYRDSPMETQRVKTGEADTEIDQNVGAKNIENSEANEENLCREAIARLQMHLQKRKGH